MTFYELTETDRELIEAARQVIAKNFDRVRFNHTVGAAVRCANGKVYTGVNCDGNHGSCAEYITMGMAISAGERDFDTIVAVHEQAPNHVLAPCGNCRQMLMEYCPEIKVLCNDDNYRLVKVGIRDLLPFPCLPGQGTP